MFYDINKAICDTYPSLNPLSLLDYPAEDVFELINGMIDFNERHEEGKNEKGNQTIRRPASDDWF